MCHWPLLLQGPKETQELLGHDGRAISGEQVSLTGVNIMEPVVEPAKPATSYRKDLKIHGARKPVQIGLGMPDRLWFHLPSLGTEEGRRNVYLILESCISDNYIDVAQFRDRIAAEYKREEPTIPKCYAV